MSTIFIRVDIELLWMLFVSECYFNQASYINEVFTAHIPQPISTPTAFGIITLAYLVAIIAPIGMPYPSCVSGIMAICLNA